MWKDYFYFSKGQRIGIVVLVFLIFLTVASNFILPYFYTDETPAGTQFLNEARAFERTLVSRDSLRELAWRQKYKHEYQAHSYPNESYTLFPFDPNQADSITFVRLGLKPYMASNIVKFRNKGGSFKTKESFRKVYGLTSQKYEELKPYINIAQEAKLPSDTLKNFKIKSVENIIVELNSADTTELMKVSGIGRGYAKSILRFRQSMGGFVSVEQLRELYGMTDANFQKISPCCMVDVELIKKITVNTASVERLKAHPYISFYQAKAIYELRRNRGKLKSVSDLKELDEFTEEQLYKIKPYLSFE